MLNQACENEKK